MTITVSACYIYPLKSAAGQKVDVLDILPPGPKGDREWMLVDSNHKFISQRNPGCEKLALITTRYDGDVVVFEKPNQDVLGLNTTHITTETQVQLWKDDCTGYDAGDAAAQWFSEYLGQECRLIQMSHQEDHQRKLKPKWGYEDGQVSFADGFPLLVTTHASLAALQEHIQDDTKIEMSRFRPNIVLEGAQAFEEDVIYDVQIGQVRMQFVKPCTRCKITTVDQKSGEVVSKEPLKTLGKVRKGKTEDLVGFFFGQNAVPVTYGQIKPGDVVEILERRDMHPAVAQSALKYIAP